MNSTIEGELLSLGSEGFEGWAWDGSKPYDPVDIEIICNDVVIATAKADGFSLDLVKQRKGNGMHMFHAKPDSLPNTPYPLDVRARVRGHEEALKGSIAIKSPSEFMGILPEALFQKFEGYVDGIKNGFVIGWAINALIPEEPVEVELWDGDQVIAAGMAEHSRADVEQQVRGGGNSGFELALPYSLLDGHMHSLRVRIAGTRYELRNSPLTFGLGSANALVNEILRLREIVQTWEARERELSRDLMARFEALYSIQRDAFEREIQAIKTAALGFPRQVEPPVEAVSAIHRRAPLKPVEFASASPKAGTATGSPAPESEGTAEPPHEPPSPVETETTAPVASAAADQPTEVAAMDGGVSEAEPTFVEKPPRRKRG